MYECGKLLQKRVVRGAVTNGRNWIFLLVKLNDGYSGGTFKQSSLVRCNIAHSHDDGLEILQPGPDLIAAILTHWIEKGFTNLESDDWFEA
ncbi:hypothetical protein BD410DRAFT_899713 [Rickenella mellea]|uniref:Uncharacterized protein n=1 Tax=Rickenella mellea TaxID=50990 RepID=A0A4Y7PZ01_9AGAM|nr:hypothetical protein BD410DRAFT_899713 [Rickenella mellea]